VLKGVILSTVLAIAAFTLVLGDNDVLLSTSETNTRVAAGGNGSSWDSYSPQSVKINSGDSVTWYNPSPVAEPHTVTFITNESYFPPLAAPFSIPNNTQIASILSDPNIEPTILANDPTTPAETKTVIMDNARATSPVVIDSTGKNVTYLPPNSNYDMLGGEVYVNSGVIMPKGLSPPGSPPIEEFTVTFETPGTYEYTCVLHPWMLGNVVVS
jgi:plastocyanin